MKGLGQFAKYSIKLFRFFLQPMLLISVELHGVLLAIPVPPDSDAEPEISDDEPVTITTLVAPSKPPATPSLEPTPTPSPQATTQRRRQSTRSPQKSRHNRTVPALANFDSDGGFPK